MSQEISKTIKSAFSYIWNLTPGLCLTVLVLLAQSVLFAQEVSLAWDPNEEAFLGGYNVYYGLSSRAYIWRYDVGNQTTFTVKGLAYCQTYYFAVTAYDIDRELESGFSNEVFTTTPCSVPRMAVDLPRSGAILGLPFEVKGWAIDETAPSGTGIDKVHVWAFPTTGGAATFLSSAALGLSRPDVASYFDNPEYQYSGFRLLSTQYLAPGNYTFSVSARSTISNSFNNVRNIPVTVRYTRVSIDRPRPNANVGAPFRVSGWALNTGNLDEVGIDTVHIWAFPENGRPPQFLGAARPDISRPDVASFFGVPAWENAGFELDVTTPLVERLYRLRVSARSKETGIFDGAAEVRVKVDSEPLMFVDVPRAGASLPNDFRVSGWAVDLGASSGTGVNLVHVWASQTGGNHVFLGSATVGLSRPDVAAALGDTDLEACGFALDVSASLAPGVYTVTVYARSTVTQTFNNARSIVVTVKA